MNIDVTALMSALSELPPPHLMREGDISQVALYRPPTLMNAQNAEIRDESREIAKFVLKRVHTNVGGYINRWFLVSWPDGSR